MKRAEAPARFVYEGVKAQGAELRERISAEVNGSQVDIESVYITHKGITFLTDRDEEIWTPLFAMAQVMCPERYTELSRIAVDMATEKTAPRQRYVELKGAEDSMQDAEYAERLVRDLLVVMRGKNISSQDAVIRLRSIDVAPWRKFRGDGLTMHNIADLLARFPKVKPVPMRIGKKVFKGYKYDAVKSAVDSLK
jgi:hypothetical protein